MNSQNFVDSVFAQFLAHPTLKLQLSHPSTPSAWLGGALRVQWSGVFRDWLSRESGKQHIETESMNSLTYSCTKQVLPLCNDQSYLVSLSSN
jgi:hypothetical protein